MPTFSPKKSDIIRSFYIVDAKDKILGRIAAPIAAILRGKHKTIFSPHLDCGDHVIVINASQIKVTGQKMDKKIYYRHSGYYGHLKTPTLKEVMHKKPTQAIITAVSGMIPRNRLKKHILSKLKVYADDQHPHSAQQPKILTI